jgi:hypothetical protein
VLRVEHDAGHGVSFENTQAQTDAELADVMAFMLSQTENQSHSSEEVLNTETNEPILRGRSSFTRTASVDRST